MQSLNSSDDEEEADSPNQKVLSLGRLQTRVIASEIEDTGYQVFIYVVHILEAS
jgi:hypothetical protein